VVVETVRALTDVIDADRSTKMELAVVFLIVAELAVSLFQIFLGQGH
jgi:uncharacterized Rmd1/YagE family protein